MNDIPPVLDIKGLRLRLPDTARPVLDGVDLTVAAGETVALVGESGSGKSSPPAASWACCRRGPRPRGPFGSPATTSSP